LIRHIREIRGGYFEDGGAVFSESSRGGGARDYAAEVKDFDNSKNLSFLSSWAWLGGRKGSGRVAGFESFNGEEGFAFDCFALRLCQL
jgi:hypothetical protein